MTLRLIRSVGGIAGLGSDKISAAFTLSKLKFSPGETVKIRVDMDNTACKKAVKSYKFKLWRQWSILKYDPKA